MKPNSQYKNVYNELMFRFKAFDSNEAINKVAHIERISQMAIRVAPFDELLILSAEFHDLPGRLAQYEILSKMPNIGVFDDSVLDHHLLSEGIFRRLIRNDTLKSCRTLDIVRAVASFHGLDSLWPLSLNADRELVYYVKTVSILDDIDNGCIGALTYISKEIDSDAKSNMLKYNGSIEPSSRYSGIVSDSVMKHFRKNEKFNKLVECQTYADYLIFAIILGLQFLKSEYYDLRKLALDTLSTPVNGCCSAICGYKQLLSQYICVAQRKTVLSIFEDILASTSSRGEDGYSYFEFRV